MEYQNTMIEERGIMMYIGAASQAGRKGMKYSAVKGEGIRFTGYGRSAGSSHRRNRRPGRRPGCCRISDSRAKRLAVWICLIMVFSLMGGAAIEVAAGIGEAVSGGDAPGGERHPVQGAQNLDAVPIQPEEPGPVSVSSNDAQPEGFRKDPDKFLVAVDPGHGGEDEGCSSGDVLEKDINLQTALRLRDKLEELGYQVLMTRDDDTYFSLEERVTMANQGRADIYISIHQNSYESSQVSGMETWYFEKETSRDSKKLAQLVHRETLASTGAGERQLRSDADFYVTTHTAMPACLIETGFLSNKKEREMLVTEEYQDKLASGIARGIDLYFHPKTMYLTFDDGPSAENTGVVLDILKERGIKATFFVVGENVKKHPEMAKRIVEEGHTIGIHCNEHDYQKIYASVDSYLEDFQKAYDTVYEVTGVKAELFRFPGGSINAYNKKVYEGIIEEMTSRGFIYFDWNASLEDAVKKSEPEELVANARESTLGRRKVVLLAHDIVNNTALCLDALLDEFPEYEMEALTGEVTPVQFQGKK